MQDNWTTNQRKVQQWLATPKNDRFPRTQELLAKEIGINPVTITRWKKKEGWQETVNALARNIVGEHFPEVCAALVRGAEEGSIQHIRTFYELTGEMAQIGAQGNEMHMIIRVAWDDPADNPD